MPLFAQYGEGSHRLVVMDRFTGEVRWTRDAHYNFRHNAIAAGDGKVFCIDCSVPALRVYIAPGAGGQQPEPSAAEDAAELSRILQELETSPAGEG